MNNGTEQRLKQIKTTGWANQCGLAALGDWYVEQIHRDGFKRTKAFKLLVNGLKDTYGLRSIPTIQQVQALLARIAHPLDKQKVISLALRKVLRDELKKQTDLKKAMYEQFITLVKHVYDEGDNISQDFFESYSSLVGACLPVLIKVRATRIEHGADPEKYTELEQTFLKSYWQREGFNHYCDYLGGRSYHQEKTFPTISADELSNFCKALRINLNVYGPVSEQSSQIDFTSPLQTTKGFDKPNAIGTLEVANRLNHWSRVVSSQSSRPDTECKKNQLMVEAIKGHATVADIRKIVRATDLKFSQEAFEPYKHNMKLLEKNLKEGKYHLVSNRFKAIDHLDSIILNQFRLNEAIKVQDTVKLLSFMAANDMMHNYVVSRLFKSNPDYLKKLQNYLNTYQTKKRTNPRVKIQDCVEVYDKPEAHQGLETATDLTRPGWFGIGKRFHAKNLTLRKSKVGGLTCLHSAIVKGDKELFDAALHIFKDKSRISPAKCQQEFGYANLDIPDAQGMTPLHYLVRVGDIKWLGQLHSANSRAEPVLGIIRVPQADPALDLLRKPLDVALKDKQGRNALDHAVLSGNDESLEELIKYIDRYSSKIDVIQGDEHHPSPAFLARNTGNWHALTLLVKYDFITSEDIKQLEQSLVQLIYTNTKDKHGGLDKLLGVFPKAGLNKQLALIHHAIRAYDYRTLHIILHRLSTDEKKEALTQVIGGKSAGDLVKALYEEVSNLDKSQKSDFTIKQCKKMARLIGYYDDETGKWALGLHGFYRPTVSLKSKQLSKNWTLGLSDNINVPYLALNESKLTGDWAQDWKLLYRMRYMQDIKEEYSQAYSYSCIQKASMFGPFLYNVYTAKPTTLVQIMDVAVDTFISDDDVFHNINSLLLFKDFLPGADSQLWKPVGQVMSWYNWAQNTVPKIAGMVAGNTINLFTDSEWCRTLMVNITQNYGPGMGYLDYCEVMGGVQALAEIGAELGTKNAELGFNGILDVASHYGLNVRQLVNQQVSNLHHLVEDNTGVNLYRKITEAYIGVRQRLGVTNDEREQLLRLKIQSPEERANQVKEMPENELVKLFGQFTPEEIVNIILDSCIGDPDKKSCIARRAAIYLVGYELYFEDLNQEQVDERLNQYEKNFNDYQADMDFAKNPSNYKSKLKENLKNELKRIHSVYISKTLSKIPDGDIHKIVHQLTDNLNLPPAQLEMIQQGLTIFLSGSTDIVSDLNLWLTVFLTPTAEYHDTTDFLKLYDERLRDSGNGINIGNAAAQLLCASMLNSKLIEVDQWEHMYAQLSNIFNEAYHNGLQGYDSSFFNKMAKFYRDNFGTGPSVSNTYGIAEDVMKHESLKGAFDYVKAHYADVFLSLHPEFKAMPGFELALRHIVACADNKVDLQKNVNYLTLIYRTGTFAESFIHNEKLTPEVVMLNNRFKPKQIRAAFAVGELVLHLTAENGCIPLTPAEIVDLFDKLSHCDSTPQFERKIKVVMDEHIVGNEATFGPLNNMNSATFVIYLGGTSLAYAENRWVNADVMDARDFDCADVKGRSPLQVLGQGLAQEGVQAGINGQGLNFNFFNIGGVIIPFNNNRGPNNKPNNQTINQQHTTATPAPSGATAGTSVSAELPRRADDSIPESMIDLGYRNLGVSRFDQTAYFNEAMAGHEQALREERENMLQSMQQTQIQIEMRRIAEYESWAEQNARNPVDACSAYGIVAPMRPAQDTPLSIIQSSIRRMVDNPIAYPVIPGIENVKWHEGSNFTLNTPQGVWAPAVPTAATTANSFDPGDIGRDLAMGGMAGTAIAAADGFAEASVLGRVVMGSRLLLFGTVGLGFMLLTMDNNQFLTMIGVNRSENDEASLLRQQYLMRQQAQVYDPAPPVHDPAPPVHDIDANEAYDRPRVVRFTLPNEERVEEVRSSNPAQTGAAERQVHEEAQFEMAPAEQPVRIDILANPIPPEQEAPRFEFPAANDPNPLRLEFPVVEAPVPPRLVFPVAEDIGPSRFEYPAQESDWRDGLYFLKGTELPPHQRRGADFEEYLIEKLNAQPGRIVENRDFDVMTEDTWIEAKSGEYWERFAQPGSKRYNKFKSDMGARLRIAKEHGKNYELHSERPIPKHVKSYLDAKGVRYVEHAEFEENYKCHTP